MNINSTRRAVFAAASTLVLGGCGFALRGNARMPFSSLYSGFAESSSLGQEFRRALEASDVRVITDNRQISTAQVVLDVLLDQREKAVVGMNASGQVREFQLRVRLKFRLRDSSGNEWIPETELFQRRDISYNETGALAKESEEALIYRSMQTDIVQQVLRRLSTAKLI